MIPGGFSAPPGFHARLWWRDPADKLVWVEIGDSFIVFDAATGETHLLNPLPALLLQHVGHEPRSALGLLTEISEGSTFSVDSDEALKASAAMQSLQAAELVEAIPT